MTPRGFLERVQLERFRANRERVVEDVNLLDFYQRGVQESNPALKNGDLVRVFPVDLRIYNAVSLEGLVKRPGRYELRPRMRVADLVIRDELLPDAYPGPGRGGPGARGSGDRGDPVQHPRGVGRENPRRIWS